MIDRRRWRVTGPDGFSTTVRLDDGAGEDDAFRRTVAQHYTYGDLARQLGYRAEPIELEPKMVTVMADDVRLLLSQEVVGMHAAAARLRAALEDDK